MDCFVVLIQLRNYSKLFSTLASVNLFELVIRISIALLDIVNQFENLFFSLWLLFEWWYNLI